MKEDVKRWWEQAEADIRTAKHSKDSGDYYAAAFWAQQSIDTAFEVLEWIRKQLK